MAKITFLNAQEPKCLRGLSERYIGSVSFKFPNEETPHFYLYEVEDDTPDEELAEAKRLLKEDGLLREDLTSMFGGTFVLTKKI